MNNFNDFQKRECFICIFFNILKRNNNIITFLNIDEINQNQSIQNILKIKILKIYNNTNLNLNNDLTTFTINSLNIIEKYCNENNLEYKEIDMDFLFELKLQLSKQDTIVNYCYECLNLINLKFDKLTIENKKLLFNKYNFPFNNYKIEFDKIEPLTYSYINDNFILINKNNNKFVIFNNELINFFDTL